MIDVEEMLDCYFEADVVLLHVLIDLCSVIDHEGSEGYVNLYGYDVYLLRCLFHVKQILTGVDVHLCQL